MEAAMPSIVVFVLFMLIWLFAGLAQALMFIGALWAIAMMFMGFVYYMAWRALR